MRGQVDVAKVTTAQARTIHAQAWPSLPAAAAGASKHEIAQAPAAIDALIAGIRQPDVRRAASSTRSRTTSASAAITVQW